MSTTPTTATPTIRKALKDLRNSDLPDWMGGASTILLDDGTLLEIFNARSSSGDGYLIGSHVANRYDRHSNFVATYKI